MDQNDFLRLFSKELRGAIHGSMISEHPALNSFKSGMLKFAQLFGQRNVDLEEQLSQGEILIGHAVDCDFLPDGAPVKITREHVTQNVVVVGTVGSGKTNFILSLLQQLLNLLVDAVTGMVRFWIFDLRGDFLHLGRRPHTYLVNPETFYWNPFRAPPEMKHWVERFVEVFMASMNLLGVSGGQLIQILNHTITDFQKKHAKLFPSLYEVYFDLQRAKQRLGRSDLVIADYINRVQQRISTILSSSLGHALGVYEGNPIEECAKLNMVFDLRNVISQLVNLFVNLLVAWRFEYQINCFTELLGKLRDVIIIDEAEELLLKNAGVSGINIIERYFKLFRATGTGLIVASHSWTALKDLPIIQNSAGVVLMLGMTNMTDAASMARAQGMDDKVAQQIPKLVPGRGIVKIFGIEECIPIIIPRVK